MNWIKLIMMPFIIPVMMIIIPCMIGYSVIKGLYTFIFDYDNFKTGPLGAQMSDDDLLLALGIVAGFLFAASLGPSGVVAFGFLFLIGCSNE